MKRPLGPTDGSISRDTLLRRLRAKGVTVEGNDLFPLLSNDCDVFFQPLSPMVSRFIVREIATRLELPIEWLYFDKPEQH